MSVIMVFNDRNHELKILPKNVYLNLASCLMVFN